MRYVIDETSWRFIGLDPERCMEALEALLDNIEDLLPHGVCYSGELFNLPLIGELIFYDLYDPQSPLPIPPHIQERVATLFNSLAKWDDGEIWPPSFDVQVAPSSAVEVAPSIAWAHEKNRTNIADSVACLIFPLGRNRGEFTVSVEKVQLPIWFVAEEANSKDFFRWLSLRITTSPDDLERFAPLAFPNLNFVPGSFAGIKDMSKPYSELLPNIVHHLAVLSDVGGEIFSAPHIDAPGKLGAHGVNVSDENGNTKGSRPAKKDHTRTYLGEEVQFWWHTKFERDRDRIHFDPSPVAKGGKITVGIFCRHLLT